MSGAPDVPSIQKEACARAPVVAGALLGGLGCTSEGVDHDPHPDSLL